MAEVFKGLSGLHEVVLIAPMEKSHLAHPLLSAPTALRDRIRVVPIGGRQMRRLRGIFSTQPFHCSTCSSDDVRRVVESELAGGGYDLIYCHFIYAIQYLPAKCELPVVVDQQNVDRDYWDRKAEHSRGALKLACLWNKRKVMRYESTHLEHIAAYVSVCDEDRERTKSYAAHKVRQFLVAPNGVNTARYTPREPCVPGLTNHVRLAFMGSFDMDFNVDAAERLAGPILREIRYRLPCSEVSLCLIGRNPPSRLRQLSKTYGGIEVTGTVDDVGPWLKQADIFVVPLRFGAGTKLKVLEAMASGLPVVGSTLALQGIDGESGSHFLLADEDSEIAKAVCELVTSPPRMKALGHNARRLVELRHDWCTISRSLGAALERLLVEYAIPYS